MLAKHLYVDRFEHDGTAYKDLLGEIELARSEGKMNVVVDTASNDPISVEVIYGVRDVFYV